MNGIEKILSAEEILAAWDEDCRKDGFISAWSKLMDGMERSRRWSRRAERRCARDAARVQCSEYERAAVRVMGRADPELVR